MAKKIYVGANSKNLINPTGYNDKSYNGIIYSCNKETQEYTINGTTTKVGDILLESKIPIDWVPGEKYTMTIIQTGGKATLGDGSGITYSFGIFTMNNSKYFRNGNISELAFPGKLSFTNTAVEETGGEGYKLYLQVWRVGTVFENYKFKIQVEKGTQPTYYEPYYTNRAKPASKVYIGINGIAKAIKRAYLGVNGIARLIFGDTMWKDLMKVYWKDFEQETWEGVG